LDRFQEITKHITKDKIGIEVGPWSNPIVPKRDGYNSLVLDCFDAQTLREKAKADPYIPDEKIPNIEDVDLIGSSTEIADLAEKKGILGKIDYITSSHNFEHQPNPIRFLQGCEKVLRPGGVLSMAIPDRRTSFDYFRPHTTLAAWLEAYFAGRERPIFTQIFEQNCSHCHDSLTGKDLTDFFHLSYDPARITPPRTLQHAFDWWKAYLANPDKTYRDTHCSVFTPASFELLISDSVFLGLTQLQLIEISETNYNEFYVHLQRPATDAIPGTSNADSFYEKRKSLLHRVNSEAGANSIEAFRMRSDLSLALSKIGEQQKEIEAMKENAACARNEGRQRIQDLEAMINGVLASKSWHLTAPFRAVAAGLRRVAFGVSHTRTRT
jgi:hypothetical protein